MSEITFEDFKKVEIRAGKIIKVEDFPEARKPAYRLTIDFGEFGIKKSSAQITSVYKKEELINKKILAVVNFPPKQVGPFISEVLVLGIDSPEGVVLLSTDKDIEIGKRVY